jgi:hypothetical protein
MSDPDALGVFIGAGPDLEAEDPARFTVTLEVGAYEEITFRDAWWAWFPNEEDPTHLVVWTPFTSHAFPYDTVERHSGEGP